MLATAAPAAVPPPSQAPATVLAAPARAPHGWTTHTVRPGETLTSIAARYRTTVAAIAARNHLRDPDLIHAGARLEVPRTSAPARTPTGRSAAPAAHVHVVRSGDTLSGIAARYRVSLASVLKTNRLGADAVIHVGDRVRVRGAKAVARAKPAKPAAVPDTFLGVTYPTSVARAAARNRAVLAARDVPSRAEVKALVTQTARRHGVDVRLALAVSFQESGWNQRAVSPANAIGVMQVIPDGGEWASMLVGRRLDLLDTEDNVTAGVVMLRALGRATSDTSDTLAAYYQGLASVRKNGRYDDTERYVRTVLALRSRM